MYGPKQPEHPNEGVHLLWRMGSGAVFCMADTGASAKDVHPSPSTNGRKDFPTGQSRQLRLLWKAKRHGTAEPDTWSPIGTLKRTLQEMAGEYRGLQPVVAMKQSNFCGAKGHSRKVMYTTKSSLVRKPLCLPG